MRPGSPVPDRETKGKGDDIFFTEGSIDETHSCFTWSILFPVLRRSCREKTFLHFEGETWVVRLRTTGCGRSPGVRGQWLVGEVIGCLALPEALLTSLGVSAGRERAGTSDAGASLYCWKQCSPHSLVWEGSR